MKAINFTEFCIDADKEGVQRALRFYLEEFKPENVPIYFQNWTITEDDSTYKRGLILENYNTDGGWTNQIDINDYCEYSFDERTNWEYLPKTISEFISDVLRHEDFELLLTDLAIEKIYKS